jgi:hypothetical protein
LIARRCIAAILAMGVAALVAPADAQTIPRTPPASADAAGSSSENQPTVRVRIEILDSVTRRPVPRVHVRILSDARTYDGFTDTGGSIVFETVARGEYGIRADSEGYRFEEGPNVSEHGPGEQNFTIVGVRTKLTRIGTVSARTQPKQSTTATVGRTSDPSAAVAGTIAGGVESLSALSFTPGGSISIHGHDASSTLMTVNGAPVFPSAAKNQLGLLGSDVFSSAALGTGAVAGAPNGSLDVRTYDPTIDWSGVLQARSSSFGGTALAVQERGTAGRVGFSFAHAQAEIGEPLDGVSFEDTSHLAYQHHANPLSTGDTGTIRYGFSPNNVALLDIGDLRTVTPLICKAFTGPLPCGYAPSSRFDESVRYLQLRDTASFDRTDVEVHLFSSLTTEANVFGEALPGDDTTISNTASTARYGLLARLGFLYGRTRVATLTLSSYRDTTRSAGSFPSSEYVPPSTTSASSFTISAPVVAARRLSVFAGPGGDASARTSHATADVRATYQLTNRDLISSSFSSGHLSAMQPAYAGFGDPTQLTFDCANGAALGDGPLYSSDSAYATSQLHAALQHSSDRLSFAVAAYRDVARGPAVNAILPATALPGGALSPAYLSAASGAASSACGRPLTISPDALYYRVAAPVDRTINDGFDSDLQLTIGRNVQIAAAYSLSRARAFGSGFAFAPAGDLAAGAQMPMVPLHRAAVKIAAALTRSLTLLGVVDHTGSDNAFRASPLTTLNVAARLSTTTADVVVGVQNLGNVNAGPFARFDPFPVLASPGLPRTYSVRYRLAVGRQGIDRATLLSPPLSRQQGFAFMPRPFQPLTSGGDWLAPDKQSPLCGAEQVATAQQYQDAIRAYDSDVRAALEMHPDLQQYPERTFGAVTLSYVRGESAYAIRISVVPKLAGRANAFMRCTVIHSGSYDEAVRLRIYSPSWRARDAAGFALFYSPAVGVYLAPEAADETSREVGVPEAAAQAQSARDAFAIDVAHCPATYRGAVGAALADIRRYVDATYAERRAVMPEGFAVAKHAAKTEPWLEFRADDLEFGEAVVRCVNAPDVSAKELAAKGLGGANFPSFDYAPSRGFYRAVSP